MALHAADKPTSPGTPVLQNDLTESWFQVDFSTPTTDAAGGHALALALLTCGHTINALQLCLLALSEHASLGLIN